MLHRHHLVFLSRMQLSSFEIFNLVKLNPSWIWMGGDTAFILVAQIHRLSLLNVWLFKVELVCLVKNRKLDVAIGIQSVSMGSH